MIVRRKMREAAVLEGEKRKESLRLERIKFCEFNVVECVVNVKSSRIYLASEKKSVSMYVKKIFEKKKGFV